MVKIYSKKIKLADYEVVRRDGIFHKKVSPLVMGAKINPKEYTLVHEGNVPNLEANSAMSMRQGFNGKHHLDTNVEVLSSGLAVPRSRRFITQLVNVNQALNGNGVLYDANGDLIEGEKLSKYAHILNHHCWVRLNDSFESGEGYLDLEVVTITGLEDGRPVYEREPLQECLSEDCYADLDSVNEQGFPTRKSSVQKYEPGKSTYFQYPIADRALKFFAFSRDALLGCNKSPPFMSSRLGVFASAEGKCVEKV